MLPKLAADYNLRNGMQVRVLGLTRWAGKDYVTFGNEHGDVRTFVLSDWQATGPTEAPWYNVRKTLAVKGA